ncbi:hypothetical protein HH308_06225 [Gordonia sp. TBRC 11910]|uniref:Uncharacterized protein n=1 Tax=Gordonia asplenii TaxID=2725283 RepID=A0A848KZD3_9ACTN|nr:hypothetical protein [Gordonia asplenii]NMO00808.1 hypothetical protein [Gordonia asplenii]
MDDTQILDTATAAYADLTEPSHARRAWDCWGAEVLTGVLLGIMVMAAIALYPVVLV